MQHTLVDRPAGPRPIAIDVDGQPQGVVVTSPEGLKFLAVRFDAFGVDGQIFPTVEAAQRAVSAVVRGS